MKIPSIHTNELNNYFCFAFNYVNLLFFIALVIPYPWYGEVRDLMRLIRQEPFITKWHIRWIPLRFVIYKDLQVKFGVN